MNQTDTLTDSASILSKIPIVPILWILIAIVIIWLLVRYIKHSVIIFVGQTEACVLTRFGKYTRTLKTGMHIRLPFEKPYNDFKDPDLARPKTNHLGMINLKEQFIDLNEQIAITKENVQVSVDSCIFIQVVDPRLFAFGVADWFRSITAITQTTLRNMVGQLDLDSAISSRDKINTELRSALDAATGAWGIKVNRVELQSLFPVQAPVDPRTGKASTLQEAMIRQMEAERTKRAKILEAEGEKEAAIIRAEGELKRQQIEAEIIRLLNEAKPSEEVIRLRSLETLAKIADGQATKIFIPSDIQSAAGLVAATGILSKGTETAPAKKMKTDRNLPRSGLFSFPPLDNPPIPRYTIPIPPERKELPCSPKRSASPSRRWEFYCYF